MKKIIAMLSALCLLTMCGCSDSKKSDAELSATTQGTEHIPLIFTDSYNYEGLNLGICSDWYVDDNFLPFISLNGDERISLYRFDLVAEPFKDDDGNEIKIDSIDDYFSLEDSSINKEIAEVSKIKNEKGLNVVRIGFINGTNYETYHVYSNGYLYKITFREVSLNSDDINDFINTLSIDESKVPAHKIALTTEKVTTENPNEKQTIDFRDFSIIVPSEWEEASYTGYDVAYINGNDDVELQYQEKELNLEEDKFKDYIGKLRPQLITTIYPSNNTKCPIYVCTLKEYTDFYYFDFFINGYRHEFIAGSEYYNEIKDIMQNMKVSGIKTESDEPVTEKATEPIQNNSSVSKEFQNALTKADSYANKQHLSKARLFRQLTSEYGEGFPEDAATYAVENVITDYNYNALVKADSYANNQHLSKAELFQQLVSEYGEGFTESEAQYAVDNVVTDYYYNALQKAISYQNNLSMSKDKIYQQLVSEHGEKFTPEEAQYAVDNLE